MKKIRMGAAVVFVLSMLAACGGVNGTSHKKTNNGFQKITPAEAKAKIDAGGVVVVDVRTKEEFAANHIPKAVLIPNETIGDAMPEELPDQVVPLLVYCRSGRRSAEAAEKLANLGYENVYDFGGILEWPYETVTEEAVQ